MKKQKISLTALMEKRGITDVADMSPEEKVTFAKYKLILSGELVTVDTLKAFCQNQIRIIESACNGKDPLTNIQQAALHIYLNLLKAIEAPEAERESLERMLANELQ